jgi:5-formyltetrahydrofolate cyclo-ligase
VVAPTKSQLRAEILSRRRAVPGAVHRAEAAALCGHLRALVKSGETVCAYVPMGTEPGSVDLLDVLLELGARVLLPATCTSDDGTPLPLLWGEYRAGTLVAARYGLREPARPLLPATALAAAAVVLTPALAVDRRGVRLGRGAGFYDRSLSLRDPAARLVAVVRDSELVESLPAEPHDVRMTDALAPGVGVVSLPEA